MRSSLLDVGHGVIRALRGRLIAVALAIVTVIVSLQTAASISVENSLRKAAAPPSKVVAALRDNLLQLAPLDTAEQLATAPLTNLTTHLYLTALLPFLALMFSASAVETAAQRTAGRRVFVQIASALVCTIGFALLLASLQVVFASVAVRSVAFGQRAPSAITAALVSSLAALPAMAVGALASALIPRRGWALAAAIPALLVLRWLAPVKLSGATGWLVSPMFRVLPIGFGDHSLLRAASGSVAWSGLVALAAVFVLASRVVSGGRHTTAHEGPSVTTAGSTQE